MIPSSVREKIKTEILKKFLTVFKDKINIQENLKIAKKEDRSIVTDIDLFISNLIENEISKNLFPDFTFYSEEKFSKLKFPAIILDPIDGTKELSQGIPECAMSLSIVSADFKNFSWIYNPFTGFEISSDSHFCLPTNFHLGKLIGAVSRSEWDKNLFSEYDKSKIGLYPKGSIAYKLGLLSAGSFDFVVSKKPKNIWDIAAGTNLCIDRGISFFEGENEIHTLNKTEYHPPLFWCHKKNLGEIKNSIKL